MECLLRYSAFLALQLSALGVASAARDALFVFGDSYADTGNHRNSSPASPAEYKPWRKPYGITVPGFATGRYSNGRVFTDLYADHLGIKRPIPYARVGSAILSSRNASGINFAFGGSGVFLTASYCPNVSTQIAQLQSLVRSRQVPRKLIDASVAFLSVNGNDYSQYLADGGSLQNVRRFIEKVVRQIRSDIRSLYGVGFKALVVSNLAPVGCLPSFSRPSNYASCDAAFNALADYHNSLLASAIADLNRNLSKPQLDLSLLDFNRAFAVALQQQGSSNAGNSSRNNNNSKLRSCCEGIGDNATCGNVDEAGAALYTVCSSPSSSFFWDEFHPTDKAWQAISSAIFSSNIAKPLTYSL